MSFTAGESDAAGAGSPPFETMGPRYGIGVVSVHGGARGAHEPQVSPVLMPSVAGRNGSMERVADAIGLTPLGGLMPGPNAIAPPVGPVGEGYGPDLYGASEARPFDSGIVDGYPEGVPVPYSVR